MLLAQNEDGAYEIVSNKESGLGYMDIAIADHINRRGTIIEIKVGDTMDDLAKQAYAQIAEKDYRSYLPQDYKLIDYAAVFYKKLCRIWLLGKKG